MFASMYQTYNSNRNGMVAPFSSQFPSYVYQRMDIFHSHVNIKYQPRTDVSRPTHYKHDIVIGLQQQNRNNQIQLSRSSSDFYTRTPQKVNLPIEQKVTYHSFPTINSKGDVIAEETADPIVETGPQQRLPGNWGEPGMPIGDFLFPMLLFSVIYSFVRVIRNFKK